MSVARNVLAVDDERILAMYKRAFDPVWKVYCAATVHDALAVVREHKIDAAVPDLHLASSTSLPLLKALRTASSKTRLMAGSGYPTTEATVAVMRSGADVVVDKPIRPSEVMKRLLGDAPEEVGSQETPTLEEAVDSHIARVYADCRGNISETARRLGIYRSSLQRRLR